MLYRGRNGISVCKGTRASDLEFYFEGLKTNFFEFFIIIYATYVNDVLQKKIENFIRSLIKKRFNIVFPKIHLFFAASPDQQRTIFTQKKLYQNVVLYG